MSVATTSAPAAAAGSAAFPVPVPASSTRVPGPTPAAATLGQAQRAGMQVVATPADERLLDAWGRLSPFAGVSPVGRP